MNKYGKNCAIYSPNHTRCLLVLNIIMGWVGFLNKYKQVGLALVWFVLICHGYGQMNWMFLCEPPVWSDIQTSPYNAQSCTVGCDKQNQCLLLPGIVNPLPSIQMNIQPVIYIRHVISCQGYNTHKENGHHRALWLTNGTQLWQKKLLSSDFYK